MIDNNDETWNNICDELDKEALHFAAMDGNIEEMKQLLDKGYPIDAFDSLGKTALHYASGREHFEAAKFLIQAGADVNAHDKSQIGNTPLSDIAGECSFEIAKLLLDAGADPTIRGWMKLNALDRARTRTDSEDRRVFHLLLDSEKAQKWLNIPFSIHSVIGGIRNTTFTFFCDDCSSLIKDVYFYSMDRDGVELAAICPSCEQAHIFKINTKQILAPVKYSESSGEYALLNKEEMNNIKEKMDAINLILIQKENKER